MNKQIKYPVVYIYKRTSDKGRELKYSIRSLDNLTNWDGRVFLVGDREAWMNNLPVIEAEKSVDPYIDSRSKLQAAIDSKLVPDDFILFNDDFFVLKKVSVQPLYDGELESTISTNTWVQSKSDTKDYLENRGMLNPLNYDIHTPLVVNKQKLSVSLEVCRENPGLQLRSLYGNMHNIGGKQYQDCKSRTDILPKGEFVSTHLFAPELESLFPHESEFEK